MGTPDDPSPGVSDDALVEAINGGDAGAFEALYQRHKAWVHRLAWRFTGDADAAADVTQEVFIHLLGRFPGFELRARMTTYLYPVVRSLSVTHLRRTRRFVGPEPSQLALTATLPLSDRDERQAALADALDRLPPEHREVLLMRLLDGMSVREVAIALDLPEGTVKSRLSHATRKLRADPGASSYFS